MLPTQTKAPEFTSQDQAGNTVNLSDFRGKYVVLYFYPEDDTPGCTIEACSLRDNYQTLQKLAVVLGVSADSVESHKAFVDKYHLPFTLLADTSKTIISAYKAKGLFIKRITYIIDPEGVIVAAYPKVNPSQHAAELLAALEKLQS